MADLHDLLERESERFRLPADTAERMFERGRRRARNRRLAAGGVGVVLFVVVILILRASAPNATGPAPVTPAPVTPRSLAGTYEVLLTPADPGVHPARMAGRFEMHLSADGAIQLNGPRGFGLPGRPIAFDVADGELTTDALVGSECAAPGTYRVSAGPGFLALAPVEEACELRRILLSTRPWAAVADATTDRLSGDWTATFSCERMVRTVREAPVPADVESFWRGVVADQFGAGDPGDPCGAMTEPLSYTLRFSSGRLLIFDPPDLHEGFDGGYELDGNTLTIWDGRSRSIEGRFELTVRIDGDRASFRLLGDGASDAFFVATWESAPFVRRT